jgi:hypothetical protein
MTSPFLVADLIFIPCAGVDPDSLMWWVKGCWFYQSETVLAFGVSVLLAALLRVALTSLRQSSVVSRG